MRHRFQRPFVAILLVLSIGGHWALLQSAAWAGMIVRYSHETTLRQAVIKTFDGKHACELCEFVAAGKRSAKNGDVSKIDTKIDFWLQQQPPAFFLTTLHLDLNPFVDFRYVGHGESPPIPPPRIS